MTTKEFVRARVFGSLLILSLLVPFAKGEPENFMVGAHVFPRPSAWQWVDLPEKATISAKMLLNREQSAADIVFIETKAKGGWASATDTIERWKKNFIETPAKQNSQTHQHQYAKAMVTFFWQEGTYKTTSAGGAVVPHSDFAQYGVIIDDGTNNVIGRILGDRLLVQNAKSDFKRMVERALAE